MIFTTKTTLRSIIHLLAGNRKWQTFPDIHHSNIIVVSSKLFYGKTKKKKIHGKVLILYTSRNDIRRLTSLRLC